MELDQVTEKIIGCAFSVSNALGTGFLEKVYENALSRELAKAGLRVRQQMPIQIGYDGVLVGEYFADLSVEDQVLVELKAVKALERVHKSQCINYLRATGYRVCLLLNFGKIKVEVQRIIV